MAETCSAFLITRIQNANNPDQRRALFDELVRLHAVPAYQYAQALLGDVHWAEDATQEAFLTAYQYLEQLRDPQAFPSWLRRIVHSQCHRLLRQRGYESRTLALPDDLPATQPTPQNLIERQELQERVRAAIASLPTGEQVPVDLYYLGEQSQREIADTLMLSLAAVKKRLERARHRLAERMRDMAEDYRQSTVGRGADTTDSLSALLNAAALEGQFMLLETLLVEGMDVNEVDANGETMLHWAARAGHLEAVELLLTYHPDLTRREQSGRTALELAMAGGHRTIAACLRQYEQDRASGAI